MNRILRVWPGILFGWLALTVSGGSTNLVWRWSNPSPFGNNIADLAYHTNNPLVAVADSGQLFTTPDIATWTSQDTGTRKWLRSALWYGTATNGAAALLVVTAEQGTILTSTDASNFDLQDLGTGDWLEGIASSGPRLVVVGDNAAIYTSDTGTNWTRQAVSFANWLRGVTHRTGGPFVAVGENGLIATSPDGIAWTRRTSGVSAHLNRAGPFRIGNTEGVLVTGEGGVALYSTDSNAQNWTTISTGVSADLYVATQETRLDFANPNGALLIAGDEEVRSGSIIGGSVRFTDETSASRANPAPRTTYFAGLSTGRQLILAGRAGYVIQGSRNTPFSLTLNWTPPAGSSRSLLFGAATNLSLGTNVTAHLTNDLVVLSTHRTTNSFYVAVGDGPTILQSDSGRTWLTALVPTNAANQTLLGSASAPGQLVGVGSGGIILRSEVAYSPLITTNQFTNSSSTVVTVVLTNLVNTLGLTWDSVTSPTKTNLQGVGWSDGLWIACGAGGTLLSSATGTHWTPIAPITSHTLLSVDASPAGWVAVGELGTLLSSPDGVTWTPIPSPTTNSLSRVRWLGDRFVVVGQNGTLLTSPDGTSWTTQISGVTNWINDVIRVDAAYYAVGNQGTILGSPDAVTWQRLDSITAKSLYGVASQEGQLIAVGLDGAILRSQAGPYPAGVELVRWPQQATDSLFLFTGQPDQLFRIERSTNLVDWSASDRLEIRDSAGTLLLIDSTPNDPLLQFFRTSSAP